MRRTLPVFTSFFVLVFALPAQRADDPVIRSGDHLTITANFLTEKPAVSVQSDGLVSLPLIGKVKADGVSLTKFPGVLEQKYAVYIVNPKISVRLDR
jgi:protein involved in polysaccharide export with SLBB domain